MELNRVQYVYCMFQGWQSTDVRKLLGAGLSPLELVSIAIHSEG